MYKLRKIVSLVVKQAISFIFLINNYEMVKVTVGLKQFVVSVFLFLAWFYKSLGKSTTDSIG